MPEETEETPKPEWTAAAELIVSLSAAILLSGNEMPIGFSVENAVKSAVQIYQLSKEHVEFLVEVEKQRHRLAEQRKIRKLQKRKVDDPESESCSQKRGDLK